MPLYLVRWQNLSAAVVSAKDETDLIDTLDELADTEGASWSVYRGPLWVEFEVPVDVKFPDQEREDGPPLKVEDIKLGDTSRVEAGGLDVSRAGSETGSAMVEEIYKKAFPQLHRVLYGQEEPDDGSVEGALREELKRLVEASWRIANRSRRTDQLGRIASKMRAPVAWVEQVLRRSGDLPPESPPVGRPGDVVPLAPKNRKRARGKKKR